MFDWLFSNPLPAGSAAPDFSLPDENGAVVRLSALRGRNVVLVFYPGDDTSVCTKQLCEFRDRWEQAQKREVTVLGINPWSAASHKRFREKYQFPFSLLVDRGQKVGELYKAGGLFVKRTVYLIGPDGMIRFGQRGTPPPEEVLATAR